jgi:ATP-dependent RNA helicase DeaD
MSFAELGVKKELVKGLKDLGIIDPTEIQKQVLPILTKRSVDLIGQAQTGTGKTAAFGLPLLQRINTKSDDIQGLILCPTRELGKQVAKQLFKFTKYAEHKTFTEAVYGGEPIERQIGALKRTTHIVVATPGRLIDLIERKAIDIRTVHTVILDEADEMLSMGFKEDLEKILRALKSVERRWLFSATIPHGINEIISQFLSKDAVRIQVSKKDVVNKKIKHQYLVCQDDQKFFVLQDFLKAQHKNRGIVFCKTKAAVKLLTKQLIAKNVSVDAIHGDLLQKERDKAMRAFKGEKVQILISTDVAARGIDVNGLAYVVHYQLPENEEYFTHRSGRTARGGKEGLSICFVHPAEVKRIRGYEQKLGLIFEQVKADK